MVSGSIELWQTLSHLEDEPYASGTGALLSLSQSCSVSQSDRCPPFGKRTGLHYGHSTIEKLILTAADRRINVSFMNISQSQGAEK